MSSPSVPQRRNGMLGTASAQPGMAGMTVQYPFPVPNRPLHPPPVIHTITHDCVILPGTCKACNRGQFQMCDTQEINGVTRDGGCKSSLTLPYRPMFSTKSSLLQTQNMCSYVPKPLSVSPPPFPPQSTPLCFAPASQSSQACVPCVSRLARLWRCKVSVD